jgi:hypothetical protein
VLAQPLKHALGHLLGKGHAPIEGGQSLGLGRAIPQERSVFMCGSNTFWTIISAGQELGYSPGYCPDRNWTGI